MATSYRALETVDVTSTEASSHRSLSQAPFPAQGFAEALKHGAQRDAPSAPRGGDLALRSRFRGSQPLRDGIVVNRSSAHTVQDLRAYRIRHLGGRAPERRFGPLLANHVEEGDLFVRSGLATGDDDQRPPFGSLGTKSDSRDNAKG